MRTPKRVISPSGMRSWIRRHPHNGPTPLLAVFYRKVVQNVRGAMKIETYEWLADAPQTDTMPR